MPFHRRDVVNALWAVGLPFPIAAICTVLTTVVLSHTPLVVVEGTALSGRILVAAIVSSPPLSSAAGYVFARRLFVRHEIAVAVIYLPLMCYALAWFSFAVRLAITGGP